MKENLHNIAFSKEHYIETIYILLKEKDRVYNKDIVEYLELSKASVSVAVNKLIQEEYAYRENRSIKLTSKGIMVGKELYKKHIFLTDLFLKLGIDQKEAEKQACEIEHILSDNTFNKIKDFMCKNNQ